MKDFVLILGCPRSGTYLLQMLMNQSFSISFPIETQLIATFSRYRFLWGDLTKENNRRRLLTAMYDFIEVFTQVVLWSRHEERKEDEGTDLTLLSTKPSMDRIISESASFSDLIQALFKTYAEQRGTARWGDKSAFFESIPVERIADTVPDLKLIHIVRDGRDVYLSWRSTWHGPSSVFEGARYWVDHVTRKREWGKRHPDRYLEIKYEDLIANCDDTLDEVAEFIGEERTGEAPDPRENEMARHLSAVDTHSLLGGEIKADNKEKWRREMSDIDTMRFETIASSLLLNLGYKCKYGDVSKVNKFKSNLYFLRGGITPYLGTLFWKRQVKYSLPLVIFIIRLLGASLPRLTARALGRAP